MTTTTAVPASDTATPEAVLRRVVDEGFGAGDLSVVEELCSADLVEHQFGLAGTGTEAIKNLRAAISDVHGMAPDITFSIEDTATAGDTVWARMRVRGTATGPFFGPPSGRPFDITVIDVARVVDGLLVEHWGVPDRFALLAQTGVIERLASTPEPVR